MSEIMAWVDGGCRGNQDDNNIGGYGVVLRYNDNIRELYAGERNTTNNIQELKGIISALEAIKTNHIPVRIHSDSAYVVNGVNQWVAGWKKNGWRKADKKIPENLELWKKLDSLVQLQDDIQVIKVKGHSTDAGNNRADELANMAMDEVI